MSFSFSDPPWAPGKPTIRDVAKTSAFLQWTKPEHDGGAKIESYIIELLKSGTEEWVRVADGINILEHFLKGLMEKQEYSFRVRAVNAAGESDPSEPSDPVLCKERLSECKRLLTLIEVLYVLCKCYSNMLFLRNVLYIQYVYTTVYASCVNGIHCLHAVRSVSIYLKISKTCCSL